jgi:tryptophanyl-tRNA synthetase
MSIVFSGIQPTGNLHIGNYFGAIRQWDALQQQHDCVFCIVDLHAITVPQDPAALRRHVLETAAAYLACGIDPQKAIIYPQSRVPGHAELAWLLGCYAPLGWLNRMTQFKEKAGKQKDLACLGLYAYPVLMAADILLFKTTHVPVGDDQKQHLELARDLASAFNRHYNHEVFPLPDPLIQGEAARLMSLRDGTKKMSKSDPSDYARVNLTDDADTISLKIQKAKTDPFSLPETVAGLEGRPEARNLLTLYAATCGLSLEQAVSACAGQSFSLFKKTLAEATIAHLAPITDRAHAFLSDKAMLERLLEEGADRAYQRSALVLREVKTIIGLL